MGKKGRARGKKKQNGAGWGRSSQSIEEMAKNGNYLMESYYALQGLHNHHYVDNKLVACTTDQEKEEERLRWRSMSSLILPISFRLGKDLPVYYREQLAAELEAFSTMIATYKPQEGEPELTTTFEANELSFLQHGYQLSLDRPTLRKHPALKKIQAWLIAHDGEGHITRQETVSMIPPVLLDIQKTDKVLDMCAAPGSKTTQILEDDPALLIANDANDNRAYMLVHQLRRIMYHHPSILVTNTQAQNFPSSVVQFDKILCDVPCTGDGTPRKNIDVWRKWNVVSGISLHFLQLQIAKRGVFRLLKVGGLMCYSTCSLNPMENEAIVAELIRASDGSLELVDCSELLGSFRVRPGLSKWKVMFEHRTSSRDRKNQAKKNNAKMEERRAEFEESKVGDNEKEEGNVKEEASVEKNEEEANGEKIDGEDEANVKEDEANAEKIEAPKEPVEIFEPTSWDESALLEDAAKRGLLHFDSFEAVPESLRTRLRPSLFAPTPEEAASFHLERCVRCLAQDNNSGGFFVAILRKTAPMTNIDKKEEVNNEITAPMTNVDKKEENNETTGEPCTKKPRLEGKDTKSTGETEEKKEDNGAAADKKPRRRNHGKALGTDSFRPLEEGSLDALVEFFGLTEGFRRELFFTRTKGEGKVYHYIAPEVKTLIDLGIQERVKVVNTGLKAFSKNSKVSHCTVNYRVCQEAIHLLVPHMTKRKIMVNRSDFQKCLGIHAKATELMEFSDEFAASVKELSTGSFVVILNGYEERHKEKMIATMWKCRGDAVDGLVGKAESTSILKKVEGLEGP